MPEEIIAPESEGEGSAAQVQESAFKKYLEENNLTEEEFLNKYKETEEAKTSYEEDLEAYREQLERFQQQQAPAQQQGPLDKQQFFNKFAENPDNVLKEYVSKELTQYNQYVQNLEREMAISFMENQKDYYDGIERDVERVIRKNQALLSSQGPMQRMRFALKEIRREKQPKAQAKPAVVASQAARSGAPSKDPKTMSAAELKEWLVSQGAQVADY